VNGDWQSFLAGGLSALIDSQHGTPYTATDPRYSTQGGVAGQAQQTPAQQLTSSPVAIVLVVAVVGLVVYLIARK
jgi:hypothetical protein